MSDNGQVPLIQDMNMIQQRVRAMYDHALQSLIADFEQFEADGYIGDCTLRREAETIGAEVKDPHNVVIWMKQVAFETYRELYWRSLDRIAGLEAALAAERARREAAEAELARMIAARNRDHQQALENGAAAAAERERRKAAEWVLKEIRIRLHAAGRRPEECWEMSEIDGHLAQFERHKD